MCVNLTKAVDPMSEIKPVLRQMIDNNNPYWRPETIRGAHKQLDEYEAKAKAFDEISFVFVDSLANDYDDHSIVQNIAKVIENENGDYYV